MGELIPYREQFEHIVDIIESAKERAYRKVNEELILMYRDIGEYISSNIKTLREREEDYRSLADIIFNASSNNILENTNNLLKIINTYEV